LFGAWIFDPRPHANMNNGTRWEEGIGLFMAPPDWTGEKNPSNRHVVSSLFRTGGLMVPHAVRPLERDRRGPLDPWDRNLHPTEKFHCKEI